MARMADIEDIELTLKQMERVVVCVGKDEAQTLADGFLWNFTQEQTGMLTCGITMTVQIDYKTTNGQRYTTKEKEYFVCDSAVNGVI